PPDLGVVKLVLPGVGAVAGGASVAVNSIRVTHMKLRESVVSVFYQARVERNLQPLADALSLCVRVFDNVLESDKMGVWAKSVGRFDQAVRGFDEIAFPFAQEDPSALNPELEHRAEDGQRVTEKYQESRGRKGCVELGDDPKVARGLVEKEAFARGSQEA